MKRLVVLLLAAGGALLWWRNRSSPEPEPFAVAEASAEAVAPPQLGGEVDADLLGMLACPLDRKPVTRVGNYLVCSECQRHYPIRGGIPVMLIDEALTPEQAAATPN